MKASFSGEERSILQVRPLRMEPIDIRTIEGNLDRPIGVCDTASLDRPDRGKVE